MPKTKKRKRPSPSMMLALDYLKEHSGATHVEIMKKTGVSRATAYNAIKAFKPKTKIIKKIEKSPVSRISSNSVIPEALKRAPRFTLDGFHLDKNGDLKVDGKLLWADVVYKGICPVCAKEVDLFKNAICFSDSGKKEVAQSYSGRCRHCDILVSLNRRRK
jgi:Fe2+ or Zn2+ uptake regulation protein